MSTTPLRRIAALASLVTVATGLVSTASVVVAHAAPAAEVLCEIDGKPITDAKTCTPKPEVAPQTVTLVSDPFRCGMATVPTTITTTNWTVTWDEAEQMWQVDSTSTTRRDSRPVTAREAASCEGDGQLGEPPLPPELGPAPIDLGPAPMDLPLPGRPATVTRTYSVVTDSWKGREAARRIQGAYRDGSFGYRELAWAWQTRTGRAQVAERHQQVTVTLPATASRAQWIAAVNKATTRVGDVRSASRVGSLPARGTITTAWLVRADSWQLGRDPRTHRAPQVFLARS